MAVTSVMAIAPMSAFAENETGGSTNVLFNVPPVHNSPEFTITIPASVDLNSTTRTATITAENVYLDTTKHKQINVTLDSASNTASGNTFHVKNTAGDSTATYSISKGETAVAVGDTVAEFTGDSSVTLNFSEPTGVTYAGTHTETLTFGIAVKNAVTTRTVTFNTDTDGKTIDKDGITSNYSFDSHNNLLGQNCAFSVSSGQFTKIEVTAEDTFMTGKDSETMNDIEGWSTDFSTATWIGKSSTVPVGNIMGNDGPVTIVFTIEE